MITEAEKATLAERMRWFQGTLDRLLALVEPEFTGDELRLAQEFLAAREYRLAFEELTGVLAERDRPVSPEVLALAEEVAGRLGRGVPEDECLRRMRERAGRPAAPDGAHA